MPNEISYIEIPAKDITATKDFFSSVFGWDFIDYGSDYSTFSNPGMNGGFFTSDQVVSSQAGSPLIVLYSKKLEETQTKVTSGGGSIIQAIFSFPGGRRFHFTDPSGNEFAVWSE